MKNEFLRLEDVTTRFTFPFLHCVNHLVFGKRSYLEYHCQGGGVCEGGKLGDVTSPHPVFEQPHRLRESRAHRQLLERQTLLDLRLLFGVILYEH